MTVKISFRTDNIYLSVTSLLLGDSYILMLEDIGHWNVVISVL